MIFILIPLIEFILSCVPAVAHDQWADGSPIPDWVKASCCGPADAHKLTPEQVHHLDNGNWKVDGLQTEITSKQTIPSQDGNYWVFYRDPAGSVYCFFAPLAF